MVKPKFCISSLLTEFAGVIKSKLFPQCKPKDSSGFKYILLFFNRMILNSGRHTQPDPQSCRVRSTAGRRGGAQKQTTHQETKTKLSSATPNRNKTIHRQRKHRKSIPPTMSQRNQHLTHAILKPATTTPKQFQTTWCFGKDWRHAGGARDLQSATVFPGILPFRCTYKSIVFGKDPPFFAKKRSLQQSHFRGRKHIGFLESKKWSSPVALKACCLNKTNFALLA